MRIVIDTNVVASAIFFGGRPKDLIELVVSKKLDAYGPGGTVPPGPHVTLWFFHSLNRSILISMPLLSFEFVD